MSFYFYVTREHIEKSILLSEIKKRDRPFFVDNPITIALNDASCVRYEVYMNFINSNDPTVRYGESTIKTPKNIQVFLQKWLDNKGDVEPQRLLFEEWEYESPERFITGWREDDWWVPKNYGERS